MHSHQKIQKFKINKWKIVQMNKIPVSAVHVEITLIVELSRCSIVHLCCACWISIDMRHGGAEDMDVHIRPTKKFLHMSQCRFVSNFVVLQIVKIVCFRISMISLLLMLFLYQNNETKRGLLQQCSKNQNHSFEHYDETKQHVLKMQ